MTVAAVERAFQLLQAVPSGDGTLSSLAADTGLPIATVSRIMGTLEQAGAVLRTDKTYRIGPAVMELADSGSAAYDLLALAATHLTTLANATNETAGIVEAAGTDVIHLGQVATEHHVSVRDWTGFQVAAHSGSIGFVVMAYWPVDKLEAYLAGDLEKFSPFTVTEPGRDPRPPPLGSCPRSVLVRGRVRARRHHGRCADSRCNRARGWCTPCSRPVVPVPGGGRR